MTNARASQFANNHYLPDPAATFSTTCGILESFVHVYARGFQCGRRAEKKSTKSCNDEGK
jgi:hypothetical protein